MIWYDMIWYDDVVSVCQCVNACESHYDVGSSDGYLHYISCQGMIWYDMVYEVIWYDMIWYDMIWYDTIWYMIWYDMIWYDLIVVCCVSCVWCVGIGRRPSEGQKWRLGQCQRVRRRPVLIYPNLYTLHTTHHTEDKRPPTHTHRYTDYSPMLRSKCDIYLCTGDIMSWYDTKRHFYIPVCCVLCRIQKWSHRFAPK